MWRLSILSVLFVGLLVVAGCGRTDIKPIDVSVPSKTADGEHSHKPSAHGGLIVPVGTDNYHAEVVFEKGGAIRLFILGKDESRVQEVDVQKLPAYVKRVGESESASFTFTPRPQPEDSTGKTSQFVGVMPEGYQSQKIEITVQNIMIAGERLRFSIHSESVGGHDTEMPAKVTDDDERQLYLTAGGKYSQADIEANGRRIASQVFKGQMTSHNDKPEPGDKVCPISSTKANEKFIWVVGGEKYEFCCPPCVDEFVKMAKEQPEKVKPPSEYVKK